MLSFFLYIRLIVKPIDLLSISRLGVDFVLPLSQQDEEEQAGAELGQAQGKLRHVGFDQIINTFIDLYGWHLPIWSMNFILMM